MAQDPPEEERGFDPGQLYQFSDVDSVNLFNGALSLRIPLGGSYPVGGGLSYGLTLVYSSKVWDFEGPEAAPSGRDNAGLGWVLTLGRLIPPEDPANPTKTWGPESRWQYLSPDGAIHGFGPAEQGVSTTSDGSYLRMQECGASTVPSGLCGGDERLVELPGGTMQVFRDDGRLRRIQDRHGNFVTITYPAGQWTIRDQHNREHRVFLRTVTLNGTPRQLVDRVELEGFDGSTATYTFRYRGSGATLVRQPSSHPDCQTVASIEVPFLEEVELPDGSKLEATYAFTNDAGSCSESLIDVLTLPTGGRIDYGFASWHFPPQGQCATTGPPAEWAQPSPGIIVRDHRDPSGALLGRWLYTQELLNGPSNMPSNPCADADEALPPEVAKTTVVGPHGHRTVSYFSVWAPPFGATSPAGFNPAEYGLPIHRGSADGTGNRYLSSETYDCSGASCTAVRKTYLRYDWEHFCDTAQLWGCRRDDRVISRRTVYVDDAGRYTDVDFSEWDGLGHFRQSRTSSNLAGSVDRVSRTEYKAFVDGAGQPRLPRPEELWILNTFSAQSEEEVQVDKVVRQTCFDPMTGFLERERVLAGSAPQSHDLLRVYTPDGDGNVAVARFYGGEVQEVSEADHVCDVPLSEDPQYRVESSYQHGALMKSSYTEPSDPYDLVLPIVDRTIDRDTGLARVSRDAAGLATTFDYDTMGRLTLRDPPGTIELPEHFDYFPASVDAASFVPARVTIERRDDTTAVTQSDVTFDAFGRVAKERTRLPDNSWSQRLTSYRVTGEVEKVSEVQSDALPDDIEASGISATIFSDFDPFGRAGTITGPDGSVVTVGYSGVREVRRTVQVATSREGAGFEEESSTTIERYDSRGRLVEVEQPAGPSGEAVTATYGYDAGDRLTSVAMTGKGADGSTVTQNRSFAYDGRGLLLSESHPELDSAISYLDYDAMGKLRRQQTPTAELHYVYDRAERLTQVFEPQGSRQRMWKELFYSPAVPGQADKDEAKLRVARRHNYVPDPDNINLEAHYIVGEFFTYQGVAGRLSERVVRVRGDRGRGAAEEHRFRQSFEWDNLGNLKIEHYPRCFKGDCANQPRAWQANYGYSRGVLTTIRTKEASGPLVDVADPITYHPNGLYDVITYGNNATMTQETTVDEMRRPLWYELKDDMQVSRGRLDYTYDSAGNVTSITAGSPEYYVYDKVSRVKEATMGSGLGQAYKYDAFGNITNIETDWDNDPSTPAESRASLLAVDSDSNRLGGVVRYDPAGNVTTGWNGMVLTYDPFNMVTTIQKLGVQRSHLYTADDIRVAILDYNDGSSEKWELRNLNDKVLRRIERQGHGAGAWTWSQDYVYRGSEVIATEKVGPGGAERLYLHSNHLGTPTLATDVDAKIVQEHTNFYFPFGEQTDRKTGEALKFTGHQRDFLCEEACEGPLGEGFSGDDLDYMLARYYDPEWGRFLSVDPIAGDPLLPQNWNRYVYVMNRPLSLVDPQGLIGVAITEEARSEILLIAGQDSGAVSFSEDGTFTVTASRSQLASNTGLRLLRDIETSSKRIGFVVGGSVDSGGGRLSLAGGEIENLSTTPDERPGQQQLPPRGFDGIVGIGSDAASVRIEHPTVGNRPVSRTLIFFHEAAENLFITDSGVQYKPAHAGAVAQELLLRRERPELAAFAFGAGPYRRVQNR